MSTNGYDWNGYQTGATATAIYPGQGEIPGLIYTTLGLNGESGEVAEHAKKLHRDDGGRMTNERRPRLMKELGDVLWYCAQIATEAGLELGRCWLRDPSDMPEVGGYPGMGGAQGVLYCATKLNKEAGAIGDIALRLMPAIGTGTDWRQSPQARTIRQFLKAGLGRTLFYANRIAQDAGFTLELAAQENLAKLKSRQERGTLQGSGDDR